MPEKSQPPRQITVTPIILPKGRPSIPRLSDVPPIYRIHSGPHFENDEESWCFRIYCEETAVRITGPFTSSLWGRLIPQASELEPFVRHAVVAVGALTKLSKDRKKCLLKHVSAFPSASDSTYALKKYDESLKGMRQAIKNGEQDFRKALIACLLVFCFESLQGNLDSAAAHAESGLMLFYQFILKYKPTLVPYTPIKNLEKNILDGDLMHAYAGLDLHVMFYKDTRPLSIHRTIIAHLNMHIQRMPTKILDSREARDYWLMITRRNYHFLKIALADGQDFLTESEDDLWEGSHQGMECMMSSAGGPPEHLREEYSEYTDDMRHWDNACSPIFNNFRENGTRSQKLLVDILKMHEMATNIILKGPFLSSELDYDALFPDFRKILSLAQVIQPELLTAAEGSAGFHFGYGVNYPLFLVGVRCRNKSVRDEAIHLLGSRDHREGTWDAKSLACIAGWVRDIELAGTDPKGFIPEDQRVFLTSCNMDLRARNASVRVGQRTEDGLAFRNALVTW